MFDMWLLVLLPVLILPWVVRAVWPHKISWAEMGVTLASGVLITSVVYAVGAYNQTADVEIINGEVVKKTRVHGSYVRSYQCNCHQVCSGSGNNRSCSQVCQTCFEDRYTVTWRSHTNIGDFTINHLDRTSQSVYMSPDPHFYAQIDIGDPVAKQHNYVNYVKAAPDSLFHHFDAKSSKFKDLVPDYPINVFNYYHVNRAITAKVNVPDLPQWNQDIALMLRKLGPQKQANVVVVFANTADQSYMHALEGKWIGGKKNDIIIVLGVTSYPKIDWVGVSSWTDSQLFKVKLRDDIMSLGTVNRPEIIKLIDANAMELYKRKEMKDFEYLKNKAEPPIWVLTLAIILGIITSIGSSFYFYRNNPLSTSRYR